MTVMLTVWPDSWALHRTVDRGKAYLMTQGVCGSKLETLMVSSVLLQGLFLSPDYPSCHPSGLRCHLCKQKYINNILATARHASVCPCKGNAMARLNSYLQRIEARPYHAMMRKEQVRESMSTFQTARAYGFHGTVPHYLAGGIFSMLLPYVNCQHRSANTCKAAMQASTW